MEDFLNDKCLRSNGQPVTSEELELTFDYSFLAPPVGNSITDKAVLQTLERSF
jgi:hypothetical protein